LVILHGPAHKKQATEGYVASARQPIDVRGYFCRARSEQGLKM
jgi:hypothetical protein